MGCDGGTIPTRDELVRLKKKPEQKDRDSEREFKWKRCALTQEPLLSPIMACQLGRLYNKESLIEFLLDKSKFQGVTGFDHIKGLKDVKALNLTPNPAYKPPEGDKGHAYIDRNTSQYICPISGLEMGGRYRFCYLIDCSCVFAERALKEIKTDICNKCGKPYKKEDVVILNGTDEDVEQMKERLEARRLKTKLEKKAKRKATDSSTTATTSTDSSQAGPSTSKIARTDEPDASKLTKDTASSKSKLTNGKAPSRDVGSKAANGKPGDKKPKTVQEDPRASEAYKSLFTTHEKCKNQQKAHWVTHNPCYY